MIVTVAARSREKRNVVPIGGRLLAAAIAVGLVPTRNTAWLSRTFVSVGREFALPPGAAVTNTVPLRELALPAESVAVTVTACGPAARNVCDVLAPTAVPSPKLQLNDTGPQTSDACAANAVGVPARALAGADSVVS